MNRQFIQDRSGKGYTIRCPANCEGSEVTEIHHFRLMGKDQVSREWEGGGEGGGEGRTEW